MFFFAGSYFIVLYYLPIYFQSIHNASPIGSGVRMLAMIIPLTIFAIIQGPALAKIRIAPIFWIIGAVFCSIACGLFYTMNEQTGIGKWIGYQIIAGAGIGWGFQTAAAVAQVKAQPEDMSQVTAIIFCKSAHEDGQSAIDANPLISWNDNGRCDLTIRRRFWIQQSNYQDSSSHCPGHQSGDSIGDRGK